VDSPNLTAEIHALIDQQIIDGKAAEVDSITAAVTKRHKEIRGSDKDFWLNLAYPTLRDTVRGCIGKYRETPKASTEPQLMLPGWKKLQRAYFMTRKDRFGDMIDRVVPIDQCTDDELLVRAGEYRTNAAGLVEHAQELEQYVARRQLRAAS
jgi:hypothetical protein